jgi:hypothetical protein
VRCGDSFLFFSDYGNPTRTRAEEGQAEQMGVLCTSGTVLIRRMYGATHGALYGAVSVRRAVF